MHETQNLDSQGSSITKVKPKAKSYFPLQS